MRTTIVNKRWEESYVGSGGCPGGVDSMFACITQYTAAHNGRVYQTEVVKRNGVIVYSADYPAGTEYAEKRVARYA